MFQKNTFLTISQAAKKTDVPSHVLRFWEKKFLFLKPKKAQGGRRYYSSDDMEVIFLIKKLLYEKGFTIKGAINFMNLNYNNDNKLEKSDVFNNILIKDIDKAIDLINDGLKLLNKNYINE